MSADGISAIVGGDGYTNVIAGDYKSVGVAGEFTRNSGIWRQQGNKLAGFSYVGEALDGLSVAIRTDGNTAIVGAEGYNNSFGAAWILTRRNGTWLQHGQKLVCTSAKGKASLGGSVAISADGNTAIVGGPGDHKYAGAAWVFVSK